MKLFLIKVFVNALIVASIIYGYSFVYDRLLPIRLGPNTKQQIVNSFHHALGKQYGTLVLGNSRIYRGVNPDHFSLPTYNFAHDNDSYNQMYYKLQRVYEQNKISTLILGVDYFSFSYLSDQRNYVYGELLGNDYLRDYYNHPVFLPPYYWLDKARQQVDNYMGFDRTKLFMRSVVFGASREKPELKENGQYLYPGKAKAGDSIQRDHSIKDLQKHYFEEIISFCDVRKIKVFLIMPPVRDSELKNYPREVIEEFTKYFTSFQNVTFLDFSQVEEFKLEDYTDITHLNARAADRFTQMVNTGIQRSEDDIILSSLDK